MDTTSQEVSQIKTLLERIAHAVETLAKAADPEFKDWVLVARQRHIDSQKKR